MSNAITRQIKKRFVVPYACYKLVFSRRSFVHQTGWLRSVATSQPRCGGGKPVPWMNYAIVSFLAPRLRSTMEVFEFGSGFSTCFYAVRCRSVVSVEYQRVWFERVRQMVPDNVTVLYCDKDDDGQYCRMVTSQNTLFDLVVVDGHDRAHCIDQVIGNETQPGKLTSGGVLLLDDSDRPNYRDSVAKLHANGFRSLPFKGIKPNSTAVHETTIFYRDHNCLGI